MGDFSTMNYVEFYEHYGRYLSLFIVSLVNFNLAHTRLDKKTKKFDVLSYPGFTKSKRYV
jgi:hypothetical protein